MNLIERAARKLSRPRSGSLIEQAADRLDKDGEAANKVPLLDENPAPRLGQASSQPSSSTLQRPLSKESRRVTLDLGRLHATGVLTWEDRRSRLAEEFRMIKRPLLLKAFRGGPDAIDNGHLIMVTSAKPGEGKTFMALSLAMSIATERDLTVLLVDADLTKPTLNTSLGIKADLGLVDILERDEVDISDVILRTNRENLSIIPSGYPHAQAAELLASERMSHFIKDIAKRYSDRVIIFDSPPVLVTSEPTVLAMHVGQVVFVVEAGGTGEKDVKNSLRLLNSCKEIGFVLNKSDSRESTILGSYHDYER